MTDAYRSELRARALAADRCLTDKLFLAQQLGYDFVPEVHEELFSQYISFDQSKAWAEQDPVTHRLILWPRGHFKTTSIVVDLIQCILNFPDIRILIMQGTIKTTKNWLAEIAAHFTGDNPKSKLRELFPEFCGDKKEIRLTSERFITPARRNKGLQQATVTVASPKAVKTGQHYDIGFFDDLVNDQNYRNPQQLEKVRQDYMMCLPLIDPPHYTTVSGTRYAFGDLYEVILRTQKDWKTSVVDCFKNGEVRFPQYKTADGRFVGFTREGLEAIRQADPQMFSSQYLNQPMQRGGQLFTEALMDSSLIHPKDAPALSAPIMFVDTATTDNEQSDDCVILIGKHDIQMRMYVVDCIGDRWTPSVFAQKVIEKTLEHRPLKILLEKGPNATYFAELVKMTAMNAGNVVVPIDFIPLDVKKGAKFTRISMLEGLLRNKQVRFFHGLPQWAKLRDQFIKFGGIKHDDYPDTVALMAKVIAGEAISRPIMTPPPKNIFDALMQADRNGMAQVMEMGPVAADDGNEGFFAI